MHVLIIYRCDKEMDGWVYQECQSLFYCPEIQSLMKETKLFPYGACISMDSDGKYIRISVYK